MSEKSKIGNPQTLKQVYDSTIGLINIKISTSANDINIRKSGDNPETPDYAVNKDPLNETAYSPDVKGEKDFPILPEMKPYNKEIDVSSLESDLRQNKADLKNIAKGGCA